MVKNKFIDWPVWWWWVGLFRCRDHGFGILRNIQCWIIGHDDVFWFNAGGTEPDMCCKNCNENLS